MAHLDKHGKEIRVGQSVSAPFDGSLVVGRVSELAFYYVRVEHTSVSVHLTHTDARGHDLEVLDEDGAEYRRMYMVPTAASPEYAAPSSPGSPAPEPSTPTTESGGVSEYLIGAVVEPMLDSNAPGENPIVFRKQTKRASRGKRA